MNFNNTYGIAAIVAGGILIATTMSSENGQFAESRLGDCQSTASLCAEGTAGHPGTCSNGNLKLCDDIRKAGEARPPVTPA